MYVGTQGCSLPCAACIAYLPRTGVADLLLTSHGWSGNGSLTRTWLLGDIQQQLVTLQMAANWVYQLQNSLLLNSVMQQRQHAWQRREAKSALDCQPEGAWQTEYGLVVVGAACCEGWDNHLEVLKPLDIDHQSVSIISESKQVHITDALLFFLQASQCCHPQHRERGGKGWRYLTKPACIPLLQPL